LYRDSEPVVITFPEKVRRTLERVVKEMRVKENVYGIRLFGSWSRGDVASSSDVDLLILDKAKETLRRIRADRKALIKNRLLKS